MSDISLNAQRFKGRPASPGLVEGPIVLFRGREASPGRAPVHSPGASDWAELDAAMTRTAERLGALRGDARNAQAADILDFQVEVLSDPTLIESLARARTAGRLPADAWTSALAAEIAGLKASPDGYFRERASDLEDLHDRLLQQLAGASDPELALPERAIVLARDLAPSRFLEIPWGPGHGLALMDGSPTAHVAMLARARGLAVAVGLGAVPARHGSIALLDGAGGELILDPSPADRREAERRNAPAATATIAPGRPGLQSGLARTRDGTDIELLVNLNELADLDGLDPSAVDGIGLARTEFLFARLGLSDGRFPDETLQLDVYRRILDWAAGRRVVIRTLDAGGDKPVPGYTDGSESNPFLGLRGIRLSLARPGPFRTQLRALIRAAAIGPLDILIPMVTVPEELMSVRALIEAEAADLDRSGISRGQPRLGMMVEVPAAALTLDRFEVDFASIGSNDLAQYTMAAGRDEGAVSGLADICQPAVVALIDSAVAHARKRGLRLGLCGDAAGNAELIPLLLRHGLRSFSMPVRALGPVRQAIAAIDLGGGA
ncbi:MAG: phosphoenolpyruvate-utilizing N-terminal domain-containing protein [Ancalomicrobiaceae bacterium]|nr:phosphoenolpyruvate-utilizing N-terminal domain-containing protein [Ancalomicrobiaceae bacterium]